MNYIKKYTLTELLIVIIILLSFVGFVNFSFLNRENDAHPEAKKNLFQIKKAIIGYKIGTQYVNGFFQDMGRLPVNLSELVESPIDGTITTHIYTGVSKGWRGPYINISPSFKLISDINHLYHRKTLLNPWLNSLSGTTTKRNYKLDNWGWIYGYAHLPSENHQKGALIFLARDITISDPGIQNGDVIGTLFHSRYNLATPLITSGDISVKTLTTDIRASNIDFSTNGNINDITITALENKVIGVENADDIENQKHFPRVDSDLTTPEIINPNHLIKENEYLVECKPWIIKTINIHNLSNQNFDARSIRLGIHSNRINLNQVFWNDAIIQPQLFQLANDDIFINEIPVGEKITLRGNPASFGLTTRSMFLPKGPISLVVFNGKRNLSTTGDQNRINTLSTEEQNIISFTGKVLLNDQNDVMEEKLETSFSPTPFTVTSRSELPETLDLYILPDLTGLAHNRHLIKKQPDQWEDLRENNPDSNNEPRINNVIEYAKNFWTYTMNAQNATELTQFNNNTINLITFRHQLKRERVFSLEFYRYGVGTNIRNNQLDFLNIANSNINNLNSRFYNNIFSYPEHPDISPAINNIREHSFLLMRFLDSGNHIPHLDNYLNFRGHFRGTQVPQFNNICATPTDTRFYPLRFYDSTKIIFPSKDFIIDSDATSFNLAIQNMNGNRNFVIFETFNDTDNIPINTFELTNGNSYTDLLGVNRDIRLGSNELEYVFTNDQIAYSTPGATQLRVSLYFNNLDGLRLLLQQFTMRIRRK